VEPPITGLRVSPGHRPFDHGLVALLDAVLEVPLTVDRAHPELGVLADPLGAFVGAEARVVVDGVVGEVRRDQLRVPGVERLVVGADVVEIAHSDSYGAGCRSGARPFVVRLNAATGAARPQEELMKYMLTFVRDQDDMYEASQEEMKAAMEAW